MISQRTGHLWLPFTQMADAERVRHFVRGEANDLIDARGHRVFDAVSSIWTTIHGHSHPPIVRRIAAQAAMLDHATLLGATNPVAEELAERLSDLSGLDRAFFASDGASAVEAALKMALQYWRHRGEPQRTRFVRFVDAYHGDTTGAMSVSDIAVFKDHFSTITFASIPYDDAAAVLEGEDVAAVIVEPLVQAAAGMRIVAPARYARIRELAKRRGIAPLTIVDEIATGFGRTGTMFAFEQLGLAPDLVCVGKGITGGTLALSATLAREDVYDAFLGAASERKHFFHGHSYAGNPIACAAALASLECFAAEGTLANVTERAHDLSVMLARLATHPAVREVRHVGLMCAIDLDTQRLRGEDERPSVWTVADRLYRRGFFTRPIGDAIQLVPPLSSTRGELERFVGALGESLEG